MGVDYFVARDCPVQRSFTREGFLAAMALRRKGRVFALPGVTVPGGEIAVHVGDERSTLTSGEVDALESRFAPWAPHCADCPARTTSEAFGCYGYVGYPIRAATERWLVGRALQMGVGALVAANILQRLGVTGATSAGLRERTGVFFESPKPQLGGWALDDGSEAVLTSDFVLDAVLFRLPGDFETLLPFVATLVGLVAPADATAAALESFMKYPNMLRAKLVAPVVDGPASDEHDLVPYLQHVVVAARAKLPIVLDG